MKKYIRKCVSMLHALQSLHRNFLTDGKQDSARGVECSARSSASKSGPRRVSVYETHARDPTTRTSITNSPPETTDAISRASSQASLEVNADERTMF